MSRRGSDLDQVAEGLSAARDAARGDYEAKLAKHREHIADAVKGGQPLWRKGWAAHVEAERTWRRLAEMAEALGG